MLTDVNRALEKDPSLWQAYLTRAAHWAGQKKFPKAILDCNKVWQRVASRNRHTETNWLQWDGTNNLSPPRLLVARVI